MLPTRIKMVRAIACGVGITAGALTYLGSRSLPQALLAAGGATGRSADLLGQLIDTEPKGPPGDRDDKQHDDDDGAEQKRT